MHGEFHNGLVSLSLGPEDDDLIEYAKFLLQIGLVSRFSFVHVARTGDEHKDFLSEKRKTLVHLARVRLTSEPDHTIEDVILLEGESRLDTLTGYIQRQEIDLALIGHRGGTDSQRSLARRLAMVSPASVWMAPEGSAARISGILAPVDFSAPSADSLRQAIGVACKANIDKVTAMHVYFDPAVLRYEEHDAIVKGEELSTFNRFMTGINPKGLSVTPVFEESSNAARAILRQAETSGTDLIVIGTRGRSRAVLSLLGSITSQVMAEAKSPVLAVKNYGDRMNLKDAFVSGQIYIKPVIYAN